MNFNGFVIDFASGVALFLFGVTARRLWGAYRGWKLRRKIVLTGRYITLCEWNDASGTPIRLKGIAELRQTVVELVGRARDHERPSVFHWQAEIDWEQRVVAGYCVPEKVLNRGRSSFVLDIEDAPNDLRGSQVAYLSKDRRVVVGSYELRLLNVSPIRRHTTAEANELAVFLASHNGWTTDPSYETTAEPDLLVARAPAKHISGAVAISVLAQKTPRHASLLASSGLSGEPVTALASSLAVIDGIAVAPPNRRHGLATRLLYCAIATARDAGATAAVVRIANGSHEALVPVVTLMGFKRAPDPGNWWYVSLADQLDHRVLSYTGSRKRVWRWRRSRLSNPMSAFESV